MANEVKLTIRVGDDGSLDVVAKKSKQAAKETEKLTKASNSATKSRQRFHKGEKGVIGATANSTKAFSKMRDSMTGSSGLVSAYAILASNIFAATAAFNALRRAAQIQQLEQGLRLVGAAAGQNLPDIANSLKEITGNAISSEQAMRSTALAVSSGFRSDQLQQLTQVAKGASLALGRDMGDALDRLVRGTAKLEPEILDELGIMVRLDDAVKTYADRLGLAEGNLTQFDRRQAFLNATIEQGLKKFEDLSKGVESNPYDKLASALADLQKNLINAVTGFTGFTKAVEFASRNLGSLTAVATTLGLSVTRGIAPGLFNMASAAADAAKGFLATRVELAEVATAGNKLPPKFKSLVSSLQQGTTTAQEFDSANASLTGKLGALTRQLNRAGEGTKEYAKIEQEIAGVRGQLEILPQLQAAQADATRQQAAANAIGSASSLNFKETVKNLGIQLEEDKKKTAEATKGKKGLRTSLVRLGPAFKVGATGVKAFGAALFTALPYLGLIFSAITILYGVIKEKFFPEDLVKKRIDEAVESFEQFSEIQARFTASRSDDGTRLVESYIAFAGVLDQISGKIRQVETANTNELVQNAIEEQKEYSKLTQQIEQQNKYLQDARDLQRQGIDQSYVIQNINDNISDALERQAEIRKNESELGEKITERQQTSAAAVLQGALLQLRVQQKIAKQQKTSTFNLNIMKNTYQDLVALQEKLATGAITYEAFLVELEIIQRYPNSIRAAFQGVSDTVASFNSVINKRQQKTKSLFQDEEEAAQAVIDQFETLSKKALETASNVTPLSAAALIQTGSVGGFTEEALEAQGLLEELRKQVATLNIADQFKDGEKGLRDFIDFIKTTRDQINTLRASIEEQKIQLKGVGQAVKGIAAGQSLFLETQNDLLRDQVAEVNKRIDAARTLSNLSEEEFLQSEEYNNLLQERTRYETQIIDDKIIQKRAQVDLLRLTEQENALAKTRIKSQEKALAIAKRMAAIGAKLTPKEEFELQVKSAKNLIKAAEIDLELTIEKAKLQRELLILEMTANEVSKEKQEEVLKLLDAQLKITERIARQKVSDARLGVTGTVAAGVSERGTEFSSMPTEGYGVEAIVKRAAAMQEYSRAVQVATEAENNQTAARQAAVKARESVTAAEDALKAGKGTQEALDQAKADAAEAEANLDAAVSAVLAAQRQVRHAAISMVADTLTSMSAALAELGPDGAVAAAFGNFNATLLTSMTSTLEIIEAKGIDSFEGMASAAATAANVIGGIGSILKAQSQQEIAAIDRQIEAEKKRDGKSAESLAKLKQLEKKKEAMKRKEFQTDKKVKLAQAIMSTAAGIAQALSLGPLIGPIMASIVAAMGAAQIAIISGMSYQGGGGAASVGAPSQISLGDRRGTVDLAKSQSARGELAYFRGESGTGGPENFRNAFAGYKNRAEGGNTAYMVGEQGPELFVPEMPGRIVPNDDIAPAAPTNVSFNINTVDATGVEDLLVAQRGNIIGMIRQAANSYGQDFVEDVDTSVFTQSAGGVSKY